MSAVPIFLGVNFSWAQLSGPNCRVHNCRCSVPDDECDKIFDVVGWNMEANIEAENFVGNCQPSQFVIEWS